MASNPAIERYLSQKIASLQQCTDQLTNTRQELWENGQLIGEQIHSSMAYQFNELREREHQLFTDFNEQLNAKEKELLKQQQDLHTAIGLCQQALQSMQLGKGREVNDMLLKLSTIKLNQVNSNGLRFEANPIKCEIEIRAFGRIVVEDQKNDRSNELNECLVQQHVRTISYNDDISVSDDDFELVDETDSTTLEPSSVESIEMKKPKETVPTFQEHITKILNSPSHKWLLNKQSTSPIFKHSIKKPTTHEMSLTKENQKLRQSFEQVISQIQQSPNHKWLLKLQPTCSNEVENIARTFNDSLNVDEESKCGFEPTIPTKSPSKWLHKPITAPLIMHHVG